MLNILQRLSKHLHPLSEWQIRRRRRCHLAVIPVVVVVVDNVDVF